MQTRNWPRKWFGCLALAAAALSAAYFQHGLAARADDPDDEGRIVEISPNDDAIEVEKEEDAEAAVEAPAFWIGIQGGPINSSLLRTHLQLADDVGVVVESVLPKSPAEKAGLRKHDIVIGIGGEAVTDMKVLQKAVADREGKPLELKVIRLAKEMTISVTPEETPKEMAQAASEQGFKFDFDSDMSEGELGAMLFGPGAKRILGPGMVLGAQQFDLNALPSGVSVNIAREGDGPATITVKKGDKTWTVEGDDKEALKKLPDDVRPLVKQLLQGRVAMGNGIPADFNVQDHLLRILPGAEGGVEADARRIDAAEKRMLQRMKELEKRMEQMRQELEENALPSTPVEEVDPSKS